MRTNLLSCCILFLKWPQGFCIITFEWHSQNDGQPNTHFHNHIFSHWCFRSINLKEVLHPLFWQDLVYPSSWLSFISFWYPCYTLRWRTMKRQHFECEIWTEHQLCQAFLTVLTLKEQSKCFQAWCLYGCTLHVHEGSVKQSISILQSLILLEQESLHNHTISSLWTNQRP